MKQEQESTSVLILGSNKQGQLGITQQNTELKEHNYGVKIQQIACGAYFTVLLLDNQQCCVLGFNLNKMIPLIVDQVACGAWHILLRSGNSIYSWGHNDDGQLGVGDFEPRNEPTPVDITCGQLVCGAYHSLIYTQQQAFTFGRGSNGQLMRIQEKSPLPIQIPYPNIQMAAAGEYQTFILSDQLYLNGQVIPFYKEIKQLACNRNFSALVTADGEAIFWDRKGETKSIKGVLQVSMFGGSCYIMKYNQQIETLDNTLITNIPILSMHTGEQHALFIQSQVSYNSIVSDSLLLSEHHEESDIKNLKKIAQLQLQLAKKDAQIAQLQMQLRKYQ